MPREPGKYQKERGEYQRRKIIALLAAGPLSAIDIGAKIHLTRAAVLLHIKALRAEKVVRVAGFFTRPNVREMPLYGLGGEPDAEYVRMRYRPAPNSMEVQREKVRQMILGQLKLSKATSPELAILLDLSNPTMRKYLPQMHADKLIYRAAWVAKNGGGEPVAVWAAGNLPDAPKTRVTQRRNWSPLSEEQQDLLHKRRKTVNIIRNATKKPQGIFAALGL